jgi:hypothetical protein
MQNNPCRSSCILIFNIPCKHKLYSITLKLELTLLVQTGQTVLPIPQRGFQHPHIPPHLSWPRSPRASNANCPCISQLDPKTHCASRTSRKLLTERHKQDILSKCCKSYHINNRGCTHRTHLFLHLPKIPARPRAHWRCHHRFREKIKI